MIKKSRIPVKYFVSIEFLYREQQLTSEIVTKMYKGKSWKKRKKSLLLLLASKNRLNLKPSVKSFIKEKPRLKRRDDRKPC